MYLHKTGKAERPLEQRQPVQNAALKNTGAAKPAAPAQPTPAPRSASALIAAAGLPVDKLSASIIAFSRFFSLPIKPELMAAMRRQTLAMSPTATPPTATPPTATPETQANAVKQIATDTFAAKSREALSLAAAAAESKGIELNPKGLEAFAEAIDPDWQKREDSGDRCGGDQRGRRDKTRQQEEENAPSKAAPITAAGLKQMALEAAEQNPLLSILNRLPGKNGQRWIVLPFSFDEGDREFKVSLRILLETDQASNRAVCMALDIAESGEQERRWLFALEAACGQLTAGLMSAGLPAKKLAVYLQPELPPKAHAPFERELSELLEIPLARVSFRNRAAPFPCESGGANELLRSINEAV